MNNIIRLDPDIVIASSPTPFEATNHINTIKLRIYAFRAPNDATYLHTSFLPFFSLSSFLPLRSFRPRRPSFIRLCIRCTRGGRGKHVYTRREASWWRAIKKQFSASSRERAFTMHRDKASSVCELELCIKFILERKTWWRWYVDDEKLMTIDQL